MNESWCRTAARHLPSSRSKARPLQLDIDAPVEVAVLREELVRWKKAVGKTSLKNGSKPP